MKTYYVGNIPFNGDNSLYHYGRKGMKWGKNIFTDALDAASGFATGAANKVSTFATNTYNSARKGAVSAYNSGKEFITGSKSLDKKNNHTNIKDIGKEVNYETNTRLRREAIARNINYMKENPYKNFENMQRANRGIGHETASLERSRNSAASHRSLRKAQAQREYNKTLPGRVEKAQANIEKTVNESYQEVIEWLDKNKKKAAKATKSAASTVSKAANTTISTVKSTASSTAKKVGNFFQNLFGPKYSYHGRT